MAKVPTNIALLGPLQITHGHKLRTVSIHAFQILLCWSVHGTHDFMFLWVSAQVVCKGPWGGIRLRTASLSLREMAEVILCCEGDLAIGLTMSM